MYYAEEVINGILHYKLSPDAEWKPFSKKALTERVLKLEQEVELLNEIKAIWLKGCRWRLLSLQLGG